MFPATRSSIFLALLLLLGSQAAAQSLRADVKIRRSGSGRLEEHKNVIITQDTFRGVKGRKQSQSWTWPIDRVVSVRYRQGPSAFKKGLEAFEEGDYMGAAQSMLSALQSEKKYPWLLSYGNWYAAESMRRLGNLKQASDHFSRVLNKASKSRQYPRALESMARIEMIKSDGGDAKLWFKKLLDLARRDSLPDQIKARAELGLATFEARFEDADKGLERLKTIKAGAPDKEIANKCDLEIGQCYIRQQDFAKARTFFKGLESSLDKENPDPELIAGAVNGLGDCEWKLKEYDKACLTFSKVYGLFYDRPDLRSEVAWALYMGGRTFQALAAQTNDNDKKKLLERRARMLWRRATKDYAGTKGEALAKKELGS